MTRKTHPTLPTTHPLRVVYIGEKNGKTYRVCRSDNGDGWRLDFQSLGTWEPATREVYPLKRDAVAAFEAA